MAAARTVKLLVEVRADEHGPDLAEHVAQILGGCVGVAEVVKVVVAPEAPAKKEEKTNGKGSK